MSESQITHHPCGHILANAAVWSPDGQWIVYDTRFDAAGERFDGSTIERVNVRTGEMQTLYRSTHGAHCGVATCNPVDGRVVFILGPENPSADWQYGASHRQGLIVDPASPPVAMNLDARDILPPFTPGALRGGSHLHLFSGDGQWVSFTYEDHVLAQAGAGDASDGNQRNVGVSVPGIAVRPPPGPRNHAGDYFSVLVTRTTAHPLPGSDEISRAYEEAWVGDGVARSRRRRAIVFQGNVLTRDRRVIAEAFIVDLPEDLTIAGESPLEGTARTAPRPPRGTIQRRLTFTANRRFAGIQGPRHWLRSSPDGSQIALLMKDDAGVVQLWTVSSNGGPPRQVTANPHPIASAFTWNPEGRAIAHVMDGSVCTTDIETGQTRRLTESLVGVPGPRPEACVYSPDGRHIAFVKPVATQSGELFNQVFTVAT